MTHGSLFSGIGGFDLAAEWAGWTNVFHCELNPFCRRVLKYYWPDALSYEDITQTDFTIHRGTIDILTGGFPCQPYSTAGKRLGKEDARHLWPQMLRAIREIRPKWVVGENVRGLVNWNGGLVFEEVQADLEAEGYEVQPFVLPAAGVEAPHERYRVWFVAHSMRADAWEQRSRENRSTQSESVIEGGERERLWGVTHGVSGEGIASNTNGVNRRPERNIENSEVGQAWNQSEGGTSYASDSNIWRSQRWEKQEAGEQPTERNDRGNGSVSSQSNGERLSQRFPGWLGSIPGQERADGGRLFTRTYSAPSWQEFPTVSPLCDGNDGLSDRLDGITFPKWRRESIKAGGNAIVPQVAYQIFKTINQITQL